MDALRDRFQSFADEQRIERLQGCLELERELKNCEKRRKSLIKEATAKEMQRQLEQKKPSSSIIHAVTGAIWKKKKQENIEQSESKESKTTVTIDDETKELTLPSCNKEAHALWACRARSLGCGADLVTLNKCFKSSPVQNCKLEQEIIGKCVQKNLSELQKRVKERNNN